MKTKITPFLMFYRQAEEAMDFYVSIFPDAQVSKVTRYGANEAGSEGSIKLASFELAGQAVLCIDSPIKHEFDFTPSMSFFVDCTTEHQLAELFEKLSTGGKVLMLPDDYGFSRRFAWVSDRFGVSWQLNLPHA